MFVSAWNGHMRAAVLEKRSFTLIEILVSVSIIAVLVSFSVLGLSSYKAQTMFNLDANQVVAVLRAAQSHALSQDRGKAWGVKFTNSTTTGGQYALFWGTSYATSSVVTAGTLGYSSVFTDPAPGFSKTIVFSQVNGTPGGADVVVIKNTRSSNVAIVTVSALGLVGETIESNLVGYWPMDETSGSTVYDASKNNNNGTLIDGPTRTTGKMGGALSFNGTSQYVTISPPNPDSYVSVSAWFKRQGVPTGGYHIVFMQGMQIEISVPDSSGQIRTGVTTVTLGRQVFNSGSGLTDGNWHFLALTYDGSYLRAYIDGTKTLEQSVTGALQTGSATNIGYFPSYYANGFIDDVRIYNRALSATEIKNLFNSY